MKLLYFLLVITFAAPALAHNSEANINQGNLAAGGSVALGYSTYSKLNFYVSPKLEYFVFDNFSVGGEVVGSFSDYSSEVRVGPKASFYFWSSDKWAANVALALDLSRLTTRGSRNNSAGDYLNFSPSTSLLYFIDPKVAFGPTLTSYIPVNRPDHTGANHASFLLSASLSIFF